MKTAQPSRILELTKELCAIPSVSGSAEEENRCSDFIAECLRRLAEKHPGRVKVFEPVCERDPLERRRFSDCSEPPFLPIKLLY